jgi:DNA-directed RNA polymerase specialized sigma24 family protein
MTQAGNSTLRKEKDAQEADRDAESDPISRKSREKFKDRFARRLHRLYFVAGRELGDPEGVGEAVQSCYASASQHLPYFAYQGAFRG